MDSLPPWVIDILKVWGPSAAILIIWFVTHKSSEKERDAREKERTSVAAEFSQIRKDAAERDKQMVELLRIQTQILARMEPEIELNTKEMLAQGKHLALIQQSIQSIDHKISQ